ncbi:MAG: hypothetical protein MZU97_09665 [Bacillus subtilis]|nr:hypothetical protein [Bacillus subtilis]
MNACKETRLLVPPARPVHPPDPLRVRQAADRDLEDRPVDRGPSWRS